MSRFFMGLSFLCISLVTLKTFSAEAPVFKEIMCSGTDDTGMATFLKMTLDADNTYEFSTETTSKYLMGLNCEFPTPSPTQFRCTGDQSMQLYFYTQHVVQDGYDSAYYQYATKDLLKFVLSYNYTNNLGISRQILTTRTYLLSDCSIK